MVGWSVFAQPVTQRHSNMNWSQQMTRLPRNSETRNKTRNTPNRDFAIPAAAPAILGKPRKAAANAITRKKTDQDNIKTFTSSFLYNYILMKNE